MIHISGAPIMTWQTMESAPRDGTPVFITAAYGVNETGKWFGSVPVVAVFVPESNGFPGLWATPDLRAVHGYLSQVATHWMPLPPAPPTNTTPETKD